MQMSVDPDDGLTGRANRPRIVHIGFSKCGTRTFHNLFASNSIPSIHWDKGRLGAALLQNIAAGQPPLAGYDNYVCFSDLMGPKRAPPIEGNMLFRDIDKAYPDTLFVYATRSLEAWIRSRTMHGVLVDRYKKALGVDSVALVQEHWRGLWKKHADSVRDYFKNKQERLLVFNLEGDSPESISSFVAPYYTVDASLWGHIGATR